MVLRDQLKIDASDENDSVKLIAYKRLRNEVKTDLKKDEKQYYKEKFYHSEISVGSIWRSVNDLLGTSSASYSSSPSMICHENQVFTSPSDIANTLNKIFIGKVNKLRSLTATFINGKAETRLRDWLVSRGLVIPTFNLQSIDLRTLRKILGKLKGNEDAALISLMVN